MKYSISIVIIFALLVLPSIAKEEYTNWSVGPHLLISLPQDDFANISGTGEGLGGKLLYQFPDFPYISGRFDLSYLSYGEKRTDRGYGGGLFLSTSRNESFQITVGPQISRQVGRFQPYLAPMGGLYIYRTVVSMPDLYYYYGIPASETTESYTKLGWNIGAGTYVDLGIGIHIDIQLKYQNITNGIDSESKVPVFDDNGVQIDTRTIKLQGDARDFVIGVGVIFFLKD